MSASQPSRRDASLAVAASATRRDARTLYKSKPIQAAESIVVSPNGVKMVVVVAAAVFCSSVSLNVHMSNRMSYIIGWSRTRRVAGYGSARTLARIHSASSHQPPPWRCSNIRWCSLRFISSPTQPSINRSIAHQSDRSVNRSTVWDDVRRRSRLEERACAQEDVDSTRLERFA